jgi:hypothetical protein
MFSGKELRLILSLLWKGRGFPATLTYWIASALVASALCDEKEIANRRSAKANLIPTELDKHSRKQVRVFVERR